jgi:hypothetical protein
VVTFGPFDYIKRPKASSGMIAFCYPSHDFVGTSVSALMKLNLHRFATCALLDSEAVKAANLVVMGIKMVVAINL